MSADLHCHSTFSDGTKTPEELIHIATSKNLTGLCITDHDTIDAYKTFLQAAKKHNLRVISGVEFSSNYNETPIHILGYSFKLDHPKITGLAHFHRKRRLERNEAIIQNLCKAGIEISLSEIEQILPHMSHQIGRAHIAYALFKKGTVESAQEVFHKWIGEGKPCYVESENPSIAETLDILHEAGGFAVVAHPHLIKKRGVLKKILEFPFDGLEGRYAQFAFNVNQRFIDMANYRNIFITGGSDFHGEIRPHNPLGAATTDASVFEMLESRFLENS